MKAIITTISMLAIVTTLAFAQDKPSGPPPGGQGGSGGSGGHGGPGGSGQGQRPNPEEIFKKLDTNHDGVLSLDEFKASKRAQQDPAKAEAAFKAMDKNGDGQVSLEEFKAHRPQGGPGQGGKVGPGNGGQAGGGQGKGGPGGKGWPSGKGGPGQGA